MENNIDFFKKLSKKELVRAMALVASSYQVTDVYDDTSLYRLYCHVRYVFDNLVGGKNGHRFNN